VIADLVQLVLRAAAWQLIMEPPFERVFTSSQIGCFYFVATGGSVEYMRDPMRGTRRTVMWGDS
jgi:hypothetical protein